MTTSTITVFFDDLTTESHNISEKSELPKVHFKHNPLQYACQQYYKGLDCYHIVNDIFDSRGNLPEPKDGLEKSQEIARYFKNKHMIHRLKGDHITDWMNAVDRILEDPHNIYQEDAKIIGTLPRFYDYDLKLKELFSRHNSVHQSPFSFHEIDAVCKFAGSIDKNTFKKKYTAFYWTMPDNTLAVITVDRQDKGLDCWHYVAKKGEIGIRSSAKIGKMNGDDFLLYHIGKSYELYDPEDK